jgi:uncharacterized membrane protein (UPF0127 family)
MLHPIGRRRLAVALWLVVLIVAIPLATAAQGVAVPPWREPLRQPPPKAAITVGEEQLRVEVVQETPDVTLGLGYRNGLEPGTGMLFVFGEEALQSFWMKGMRFCLDIIWIADGEIVGAAERVCPDPAGTPDAARASFLSPEPVSHVLEVPAGWLDAHGLGQGTTVDLSQVEAMDPS